MKQLSLLLASAALLLAQADNWSHLRGVNPGQDTHVHLLDGKRNTGGFISATDTEIVIRQRTGDRAFPKDGSRKSTSERAQNAGAMQPSAPPSVPRPSARRLRLPTLLAMATTATTL